MFQQGPPFLPPTKKQLKGAVRPAVATGLAEIAYQARKNRVVRVEPYTFARWVEETGGRRGL